MAHVQKYAAANVAGLERHCLRRTDGHKNKDIDTTKTHLNYALDNNEKPLEYMQKRLGEIRVNQRRDDVKVAASWAVTLPRDVTTKEETQLFFKTAHSFLAHRYGEKNILWSRVHMDETTPHLHFCFMPVTPDKKRPGEEKLCAKDVLNRPELAKFHTELAAEMRRVFGREIGIETGKTESSLPLEQFKVKTKLDAITATVEAKRTEADAIAADIEAKRKDYLAEEKELAELRKKYDGRIDSVRDALDKNAKAALLGGFNVSVKTLNDTLDCLDYCSGEIRGLARRVKEAENTLAWRDYQAKTHAADNAAIHEAGQAMLKLKRENPRFYAQAMREAKKTLPQISKEKDRRNMGPER